MDRRVYRMETAFSQLQRFIPRESSSFVAFFSTTQIVAVADDHRLPLPENAGSPMRDLIRIRITTSTTKSFRFNQTTKLLCHRNNDMADEANNKKNCSSIKSEIKQGEEVKKKETKNIPPPPPPEKPLPGDCCGSGCVRCVWDVYYEELEEYNKVYKSNPDSNRTS